MKHIAFVPILIALFSVSIFTRSIQEDEPGCATDKSKSLNFLVGEWNVKSNFRVSKRENKWETTKGISRITHLFKDCVYQELLTGTRNDRAHQFTGLFSYNNMSNKLQWVGGHSEHGVLTLFEGTFVDEELILENTMMIRSNLTFFRTVYTPTRDGFNVRSERSSDKKLWDAGWHLEYTKITDQPDPQPN